jgi:hypothetical protein
VFSTACDSASITSTVSKWQPFNFIVNRGSREKQGGWSDSHVLFGKEFPGEKGSVRRCIVMMQQPVVFGAKFRGEVLAYFHAVAVKGPSSMLNWLFCLTGRIFCLESP